MKYFHLKQQRDKLKFIDSQYLNMDQISKLSVMNLIDKEISLTMSQYMNKGAFKVWF